ncbi:MAG TPA: response regulator [Nitrospirota bacterium]|nr:response regulator [Nitrospirota bacterium]
MDDEKAFVQAVAEGIEMSGGRCNVVTAENGKKALEMLNTALFDLVITDLKMPVMDGFELLEHMMKRKRPGTRVMVMSCLCGPGVSERLNGLGVSHVIEKPADIETIMDRILNV